MANSIKQLKNIATKKFYFAISENNNNENRVITDEDGKKFAKKYKVGFMGQNDGNFEDKFLECFNGLVNKYAQ